MVFILSAILLLRCLGKNGIYYYDTHKDKIFVPGIDDPDNPKFIGLR